MATAARSELDRLKLAAATAGLQLDVLGMGQPWEGLGSKITFLTKYLEGVPCDDYLLFLGV